MKYCFAGIIGILIMVACTRESNQLEVTLRLAGENRIQLQKVLDHYREDSEKYKAACFLIENMPFYGSYKGKALEKYWKYFSEHSRLHRHVQEVVDSLKLADGGFSKRELMYKPDIEVVDSAFLVEHIEWAFKVWKEQPWGKNITFDDFCEFILPYRIGDEPLSLWRKELYEKYNPMLDELRKSEDAEDQIKAAQLLMDTLRKDNYRYTSLFPEGPHVGPMALEWRTGSCREFADAMMYVLRSIGIPCGTDRVIQRGDTNASHFWNFILDKGGNTYMAEFPYQEQWCKAEKYKIYKGKVYRNTYSLNRKEAMKVKDMPNMYPVFKKPFFYDVTAFYTGKHNWTVIIPEDRFYSHPCEDNPIYLCLANKQDWHPVAYTFLAKGGACFENVEGGVVFTLAAWDGGHLKALTDPFALDHDTGEIRFLSPAKECHAVNLYRKFYMAAKGYFYDRMIGGVIEGSGYIDFSDADTLFVIKEAPFRLYTTVYLKSEKSYRYMRYRGAKNSYCNIAELAFYENVQDTLPLRGKAMGTSGGYGDDGLHEYTNVFDGDPNTSFDYKYADTGWAGLNFGKPCKVSKATYTPRNDVNFIYKGDVYELFYWGEGKWNSVGRQTAMSDSLVYSAPQNALLFLKNHSTGVDERIFEYWNNQQRFW